MAGIYLHIPFCLKACTYCDFHFSTQLAGKADFLDALLLEMQHRSEEWATTSFHSIYFGGGTPSLLSIDELKRVMEALNSHFRLNPTELTFELNPDDADDAYLYALRKEGINRLSVGFQSLRDSDLRWMNRTHTCADILNLPTRMKEVGFSSYTVDFIYGMPEMTEAEWRNQISWAIEQGIPHLSLYALTVEERTVLHHQIQKGKTAAPNEEQQYREFLQAHELLTRAGYEHYEVSNYALPGHKAVHNSNYWNRKPYLGLGPSAHSFKDNTRSWNVSNNIKYVNGMKQGKPEVGSEELSQESSFNEYIMLGLRTASGIDLQQIKEEFGPAYHQELVNNLQSHPQAGAFEYDGNRVCLKVEHWFSADGLAADLFC